MAPRFTRIATATAFIAVALTATGLAGFGIKDHSPAYAAGDCTVTDTTFDAEERKFADLINAYRQQNGVPKLTVSVNLNRAASWHAKDMADKSYFSHTDSLGRSPEVRGADCGTKTGIGENIAAGTSRDLAQEAFEAWKASSGHNRNMLQSGYKQIGIARYYKAGSQYGYYWVTDFSLNSDGTDAMARSSASPTATPTSTRTSAAATATPTRTPTSSAGSPTATATRTATATPAANAARITSPTPGSKLTSTSVTFRWGAVSGATRYQLYIGTTPGAYNVKNIATSGTSLSVSGLPGGSRTLYVRLWTQVNGTWRYVDHTYTGPN